MVPVYQTSCASWHLFSNLYCSAFEFCNALPEYSIPCIAFWNAFKFSCSAVNVYLTHKHICDYIYCVRTVNKLSSVLQFRTKLVIFVDDSPRQTEKSLILMSAADATPYVRFLGEFKIQCP